MIVIIDRIANSCEAAVVVRHLGGQTQICVHGYFDPVIVHEGKSISIQCEVEGIGPDRPRRLRVIALDPPDPTASQPQVMDLGSFKQKLSELVAHAIAGDVTLAAAMHAMHLEIEAIADDVMTKQLRDREDAYNRGEPAP